MNFSQYTTEELLVILNHWEQEATSLEEKLRDCEKTCEEVYNEIDRRRGEMV
jgi:hypothetical protein